MKRLACLFVLASVSAASCVVTPVSAAPGVGQASVTIDFSDNAIGDLDPLFYRPQGLLFPPERCGSGGCSSWFIGLIQADNALVGNPLLGGVNATFLRPVSALSVSIAPGIQGTAVYTLVVFSASGEELASQTLTVTQDSGDPSSGPPGYFVMSVDKLSKPAKSFALTNEFVRSSFPTTGPIEFGVNSISYTHWRN